MIILSQTKTTALTLGENLALYIKDNSIMVKSLNGNVNWLMAKYENIEQVTHAFSAFLNYYGTVSVEKEDISVSTVADAFNIKDHSVFVFPTIQEIQHEIDKEKEKLKKEEGEKND